MSDRDGSRPNILIILADDLGYSDIGAYGGEIDTPNLDELAASGTIFSQFYNTARCSASRASLLTGLHPHETGIGILTQNDGPVGYPGTINKQCATLAEIVSAAGYKTHISGKWHLSEERAAPNDSWPTSRGFDTFFGTLTGCGSYFDPGTLTRNERPAQDATNPDFFYTDAIGDDSAEFVLKNKDNTPFFLYSAFTAPHWPLHALESDLALMRGRYDEGWDVLRDARFSRQKAIGLISDPNGELSARDPMVPPWDDVEDQAWQVKRMEAYAAMVHCLDRNVGKIMNAIEETGQKDNTIIIFLSDNGASYEELPSTGPEADFHRARRENFPGVTRKGNQIRLGNDPGIIPGAEDTYASYGRGWANLSNTPFRMFKEWVHEGGIATPFIISWAQATSVGGKIEHTPLQLVDIVPTLLELTEVPYPGSINGREILPLSGKSFANLLFGKKRTERPLFWEHIGNRAVRMGSWKLVCEYQGSWELYQVNADPFETRDLSSEYPQIVSWLSSKWCDWAEKCGVKSFSEIEASYVAKGLPAFHAKGS